MVKPTFFCVAAVSLACVFGSCSTSTSPNGGTPFSSALHPAAVGSVFTYDTHRIDSSGGYASTDVITLSVIANAIPYQGKSNVTHYQFSDGQSKFVNYESNGNISIFTEVTWGECPMTGGAPIITTWYDTLPSGDVQKAELTCSYAGRENVTLAGQAFNTIKIVDQLRRWTNGVLDDDQPAAETGWFATETGWFIKTTSPAVLRKNGPFNDGYAMLLKGYVLK
jgi:hypothetical protein